MSVGRLISIRVGRNRVVALVYSIHSPDQIWLEGEPNTMHFEVELVGEIRGEGEDTRFSAGISDYPTLGSVAHQIRTGDLEPMQRFPMIVRALVYAFLLASIVILGEDFGEDFLYFQF